MTAIHKKIVTDDKGEPVEVIISWRDFLEIEEALGLDLEPEVVAHLKEARAKRESGDVSDYVSLRDAI